MNSFKLGKYKFVKDLTDEYPNHLMFYPTNKMYLIYDNEIYYLRYLWEFKRKSPRVKLLYTSIQPIKKHRLYRNNRTNQCKSFF